MSNFLELTNTLLRRINEVVIDSADFGGVRNVQALAKDAVNASIRDTMSYVQQWSFAIETETQTLTAGTQEYAFPADMHVVDWDSFFLNKDTALSVNAKKLKAMSYDEYNSRYRESDANMLSTDYGVPERIYRTQQGKFGVSPPPDKAYEIEYVYFRFPDDLSAATDTHIIPTRFENVIIEGALVHMMRFRSNDTAVAYHLKKFQEGLEYMRRILLDPIESMRSTNVRG